MLPAWPQLRHIFRGEYVALQIGQVNRFWTNFAHPTSRGNVVSYESTPDGCSASTLGLVETKEVVQEMLHNKELGIWAV